MGNKERTLAQTFGPKVQDIGDKTKTVEFGY
jgi:hypothetical protein